MLRGHQEASAVSTETISKSLLQSGVQGHMGLNLGIKMLPKSQLGCLKIFREFCAWQVC